MKAVCDSCKVVEVAVPATYCDGCVEEIVEYLEQAELQRVDEVSALFDHNYELEYQRLHEDGLGFSY